MLRLTSDHDLNLLPVCFYSSESTKERVNAPGQFPGMSNRPKNGRNDVYYSLFKEAAIYKLDEIAISHLKIGFNWLK